MGPWDQPDSGSYQPSIGEPPQALPMAQAAPQTGGSQYPALANQYGLGRVTAQPGAASNPDFLNTPISLGQPDQTSRGFNPWSLTGEALTRG